MSKSSRKRPAYHKKEQPAAKESKSPGGRAETVPASVAPSNDVRRPTRGDWIFLLVTGSLLVLWIIFLAALAVWTGRWG